MAALLLEARDLSRSFGEVDALQGVSFSLPEGAIGLIGPNGAGKTTLLRVLMGLIPPTSGGASVLGQDTSLNGLSIRERVGYMPEDDCLLPEMTGIGFVAYMGRVSGLPKELAFRRAHEVLQFTGLKEERYRTISEYPSGCASGSSSRKRSSMTPHSASLTSRRRASTRPDARECSRSSASSPGVRNAAWCSPPTCSGMWSGSAIRC